MTHRVVICSQKGGVGKTTVAVNLALALADRGRRVLLVDLDPQGGVGHSLAKGDGELVGLVDVLAQRAAPADDQIFVRVRFGKELRRHRYALSIGCPGKSQHKAHDRAAHAWME